MKIKRFYWKDDLRAKIEGNHGVMAEEVEEVFDLPHLDRKCGRNRHKIWGRTRAGRLLFIIIDDEGED
ncbi:MAG: hypothetical protein ACREN0_10275, partial [Thermodesulfobacteriota bacterium]